MARRRSKKPALVLSARHAPKNDVRVSIGLGERNRWGGGEFEGGTLVVRGQYWPAIREMLMAGAREVGLQAEFTDLPVPKDENERIYLQYERWLRGRFNKVWAVSNTIEVSGEGLDKLNAFRDQMLAKYRPDVPLEPRPLRLHYTGQTLEVYNCWGPWVDIHAPLDNALAALERALVQCESYLEWLINKESEGEDADV